MTSEQLMNLDRQYVMGTYGRSCYAIEHGEGATLYDFDGKAYIDFTSGIGVNSIGYANPAWIEAVSAQASKLAHISNLFYTQNGPLLAEKLCTETGMSKAFFCNSGAEANEAMIKLARKYSIDKYGPGRAKIVTLLRSFHGRTITTLAATGQDKFHHYFFPFTEGFDYVEAGQIEALHAMDDGSVCAVMLELVQGEGGVYPMDSSYIRQVAELCAKRDWLLLIDEVQTGIGRTGSLFAFQQFGIEPDVLSFAKGIAGGLPLGGILCTEKHKAVLSPGTHATTFGANPICCAAGLAVLQTLAEPGFYDEVKRKGDYIRSAIELMHLPIVKETRGLGLMIGIVLNGSAVEAAGLLDAEGLLVLTAGTDVLRFLPPLTIGFDEIERGLEIFKTTLSRMDCR